MQIRTGIDLDIAERRDALVDPLRVGEFAGVGDALVIVDRQPAEAERRRGDEMPAEGERRQRRERNERPPPAGAERPGEAAGEPQRQRRGDQVCPA